MKSSTIKRSALSKETMDVIENLAGENMEYNNMYNEEDNTPGEYHRQDSPSTTRESKSKEIDLLWQSFKPSQFNSNSPIMCYIGGILTGIISTLLVLFLFGALNSVNFASKKTVTAQEQTQAVEAAIVNEDNSNEVESGISEDTATESQTNETSETPAGMEKYVIKDGDTVEAIIKHFYGTYTPERAEAIMKANNLKNLDRISIGQVLLIPTGE